MSIWYARFRNWGVNKSTPVKLPVHITEISWLTPVTPHSKPSSTLIHLQWCEPDPDMIGSLCLLIMHWAPLKDLLLAVRKAMGRSMQPSESAVCLKDNFITLKLAPWSWQFTHEGIHGTAVLYVNPSTYTKAVFCAHITEASFLPAKPGIRNGST